MTGQDEFSARLARIEAKHGRPAPNTVEQKVEAPERPQLSAPKSGGKMKLILPIIGLFVLAGGIGFFIDELKWERKTEVRITSGTGIGKARDKYQGSMLERALSSRMSDEEITAMENNEWIDEQLEGTRSEDSGLARMILSH